MSKNSGSWLDNILTNMNLGLQSFNCVYLSYGSRGTVDDIFCNTTAVEIYLFTRNSSMANKERFKILLHNKSWESFYRESTVGLKFAGFIDKLIYDFVNCFSMVKKIAWKTELKWNIDLSHSHLCFCFYNMIITIILLKINMSLLANNVRLSV